MTLLKAVLKAAVRICSRGGLRDDRDGIAGVLEPIPGQKHSPVNHVVYVARTVALDEWVLARDISESGQARGKLVLLAGGLAAGD